MQADAPSTPVVIEPADAITLPGLFRRRVRLTPAAPAYHFWSEQAGEWQLATWKWVAEEVSRWKAALAAEKLDRGDRIAILLPNGIEWVCMEQAALALGLVPVALYNWDSPGNIAYILADCDARLLLLETIERARELAPQLDGLRELQTILALTGKSDRGAAKVTMIGEWLANARRVKETAASTDPDELATLIYTSGTTGHPKGVMLSHRNILDNAAGILKAVPPQADDRFLSVLPLAHAYERTVGYYVPMMAGLPVAFARSPRTFAEDMAVHRPTVMLVVPRLLERIHRSIGEKLAAQSGFAQQKQERRPIPYWSRLIWALVGSSILAQVMAPLGGRLRVVVCGGASLSPAVCREFLSLGIAVLQGYGMTETSPVVSSNRVDDNVPESAGLPIAGCEIKIGNDGELLVRSSSVMLGYWRQPEQTRQTIDDEGWLHTGDIAEIRAGRIYVTGRLGDVVKLATGHKVPVTAVEEAILRDPLFQQAIVVAGGQHSVKAIAVVDRDNWNKLAPELGVAVDDQSLRGDEALKKLALDRIARQTQSLPPYCRPQDVVLDLEPWSVEAGLLTPTLKAKRQNILAHYGERIDSAKLV